MFCIVFCVDKELKKTLDATISDEFAEILALKGDFDCMQDEIMKFFTEKSATLSTRDKIVRRRSRNSQRKVKPFSCLPNEVVI